MRDGEFYDILEELERAYDTSQKISKSSIGTCNGR